MKYVMFIYQEKDYDPKALSAEEHKAVAEGYAAVNRTPNVRPGPPPGFLKEAITVRLHNSQSVATPGPYIQEPGGAVGGFLEFEAETDEEAVNLASQIPAIKQGGAVEIRPCKVYW
jgi:hypothetical protein